jgi:splicing suppressor protein 51
MYSLRMLRPAATRVVMASRARMAQSAVVLKPSLSNTTRQIARPLSIKSLFASKGDNDPSFSTKQPILSQDNLFHPLSESPIPEIRDRATIIKKYGTCPVCNEEHHGDRASMRSPEFECPDCGHPTHCCEEHYHKGKSEHDKICGILREHNEDEHDLRSGRPMKEFEFPSKAILHVLHRPYLQVC